ncbi:CoA ester lyase [Dactylosporangium fulvum]|uniref:CoA ester lyase n=1 Tax=Dactylosporangium fulvum TaxID=53359 RepID=A0ABY5VTS5_9ACTN|nr:CoA ester lyase [Dactylosporangium fulvum]UWP79888.1 CoA ester lyase [Dactylosporangium fulvum]
MKYTRYCRSLLSTPASAVDRYEAGLRSGADICLVDLEDSIPPDEKANARTLAEGFFTTSRAVPVRRAVRVNAITVSDGLRDLLAVQAYRVSPDIVVLPMVESPRDIEIAARILARSCPDVELIAIVETPRGLTNLDLIATASPRLRALSFGAADYAFAAGARLSWETLVSARSLVVNSARAAGIEVIDAPTFEVADIATLRDEATRSRALGFSGKVAIHPRQVPVINEMYSPDAGTLEHARRVVAAGSEGGRRIAVVDGAMVGTPFFEASQQLIDEFDTAGGPAMSTPTRRGT